MIHAKADRAAGIATPPPPSRRRRTLLAMASNFLDLLYLWQARGDERRELARLDERLLKDAGLNRADVLHEAAKPFWRA